MLNIPLNSPYNYRTVKAWYMRHTVRFSSTKGLFSQFKENMSAKCDLVAEKVQTILIIRYHILK